MGALVGNLEGFFAGAFEGKEKYIQVPSLDPKAIKT
jgi:hypothetical protein